MSQAREVAPSISRPILHRAPVIDIGELIEINCCENVIEATMRIRALAEISRALDAASLVGLARAIEDERGRQLVLDTLKAA